MSTDCENAASPGEGPSMRYRASVVFPLIYSALGIVAILGWGTLNEIFVGTVWFLSMPLGFLGLAVAGELSEANMYRALIYPIFLGAVQWVILGLLVDLWLAKRRRLHCHSILWATCPHCGYSLIGNVSGRCSECGALIRGARGAHDIATIGNRPAGNDTANSNTDSP